MTWETIGMLMFTAVVVPTGSWLIRSTIKTRGDIDTHKAEDTIHFKNIAERLTELQNTQTATNTKLDRLIERFL